MAFSYNKEWIRKSMGLGTIGNEEDAYPLRSVLISLGPHWHSISSNSSNYRSTDMLKLVLFICVTKVEVVVLRRVRFVKDWRF